MNVSAESLLNLAVAAGAPIDLTGEGVVRWVINMLRGKVVRKELEALNRLLVIAQQRAELAEKNVVALRSALLRLKSVQSPEALQTPFWLSATELLDRRPSP